LWNAAGTVTKLFNRLRVLSDVKSAIWERNFSLVKSPGNKSHGSVRFLAWHEWFPGEYVGLLLRTFKEVFMKRELIKRVLAVTLVLIASAGVATIHSSKVRAADQKYQLVENWAQLPPGMQWGVMSAVDIDSHGTIYAFKRSEPGEKAGAMSSMVMVIDPHGKFLRSWGEHTFMSAHGLRVLRDGFIWITDKTGDQVFKFSPDGELLMTLGKKGVAGDNDSTDALNGPSDVVIGKNGDIFVSDGESTNTRVVKFSKDGKFIKCWGTKGSGPGELNLPHNIAMDSEGRLYVADRTNKRIQVFDQDGKYLDQMTQFGAPAAIFITKDDMLYVVAGAPENWLTIGTKDGKVLDKVEGLNAPHWVAVDSSGAVYIAEVAGQALLKFVKK
jgi:sugar lactone lactonase YvrE